MTKYNRKLSWMLLMVPLILGGAAGKLCAQTPPPIIFFTDLQSGPNSGGDSQSGFAGAYVTLYGNFFGASQGTSTVTLNGSNCLRVVSWGTSWLWYQKLVVQLGSSCLTGNFVVTTSAGASNGVPFTVRSGNIYCVSTSGSDSNSGQFPSSCWATVANASSVMGAGSIVYVENGVDNTTVVEYQAIVNIWGNPGGTSTSPIAFVAYPGATATIGDYNNTPYPIRVPQISLSPAYYVIAGLTIRGQAGIDLYQSDHFWLIGNDMSCSEGTSNGCIHTASATNLFVYGNNIHDIAGDGKLYHGMYYSTNTNHVWVGWNIVDPDPNHTGTAGCRGIQFYSTGGSDQYDLHVHDNIVRDTICDAINFNTVNPGLGTVEAYNNVIYHAGTGPDPQGEGSNYGCFDLNTSAGASAPTLIYNNSMYDCGSREFDQYGGLIAYISATVTNNSIYMLSGETYISSQTVCSLFTGTDNDWYGNGAPPCSNLTANLNVNPQYTNTTLGSQNLAPLSGSPLFGAGSTGAAPATDITGLRRPNPPSIGAYDVAANGTPPPAAPTNLTVTVQ